MVFCARNHWIGITDFRELKFGITHIETYRKPPSEPDILSDRPRSRVIVQYKCVYTNYLRLRPRIKSII